MSDQDILVAKHAVLVEHDGQTLILKPGTTVRAGHPLVDGHEGAFEPLTVQYDVEGVTETPAAAATSTEAATNAAAELAKQPRGKAAQAETR